MKGNLDDELKSYFSQRDEVPQLIKAELSARLQKLNEKTEKIPLVWLVAPVALLVSIMAILTLGYIFGALTALLTAAIYYSISSITAVLIIMLFQKSTIGGNTYVISNRNDHFFRA